MKTSAWAVCCSLCVLTVPSLAASPTVRDAIAPESPAKRQSGKATASASDRATRFRFGPGAVTTTQTGPTGTTVITHGLALSGTIADWPFYLAETIRTSAGIGQVLVYDPTTGALSDCQHAACTGTQQADGETIVVFDWANDSRQTGQGFSEAAGEALMALLVGESQTEPPKVTLSPLHLIGHSRGTIVNSEAAERLIAAGFPPPEQVTTLDPHDSGSLEGGFDDFDVNQLHDYDCSTESPTPGLCSWAGTGYNDNYWRSSFCFFDPDGITLLGATNLNLTKEGLCHSDVHYWYFFTADLGAVEHPDPGTNVAPGEDWYGNATSCAAADRTTPQQRAFEGFQFSRIAGGESLRCPDNPGDKEEVLFDYGLSEGLVNGDFERTHSSSSSVIPGWSFHGGGGSSGTGVESDGDNYLEIESGNWRRHGPAFVPATAIAVRFCRVVSVAGASDLLRVVLAREGALDRVIYEESLTSVDAWRCFEAALQPEERGTVVQLSASVAGDGAAVVGIDDVGLEVALFADGFESGDLSRWSDSTE